MLDKIYNSTRTLEKAMDASWTRNEAISQNIANVDTPGYKRKSVQFEEVLNQAMDGSDFKGIRKDKRHIPIGGQNIDDVEVKITEDNSNLSQRLDGNNVDIEKEMADMAKNTIQYNVLSQRMSGKFKTIMSAINEGRR